MASWRISKPSKAYIEKKLQELENGIRRDELDPDTLLPVWDACKGHITVKRDNGVVAAEIWISDHGGASAWPVAPWR